MMVESTREALTWTFYSMAPEGWWVSLYGFPLEPLRRWSWRRMGFVTRQRETQSRELTPRIHVGIRQDGPRILAEPLPLIFPIAQPGRYILIGIHAAPTGDALDFSPLGSPEGTIVASGDQIRLTVLDWALT